MGKEYIKCLTNEVVVREGGDELHMIASMCWNEFGFFEHIFFYEMLKVFYYYNKVQMWLDCFIDNYIIDYEGMVERKIKLGNWGNKKLFEYVEKDLEKNYRQTVEILLRLVNNKHEAAVTNYVLGNWNENEFWNFAREVLLNKKKEK